MLLPPPPGTFKAREELIAYIRDFAANQGYAVTIKDSRRDKVVVLGCHRGGVYRNRRKSDDNKRKRSAASRLINCPFEAIGKKDDDIWVLAVKNGEHNHEPLKDISEHPASCRFSEEEVRLIKEMTEAGAKPLEVLKTLKHDNPQLQSTPRHLYNLKAKIRQGNFSEKSFKSWRPSVMAHTDRTLEGTSTDSSHQLKVSNFIGGKFVESQGNDFVDVLNPATQEVVSQVPSTTYEEFKAAVLSANRAFPSWKRMPIAARQHIMLKLQELIRRDIDELVLSISTEEGKSIKDARSDVLNGLEVVELFCGTTALQMGEFVSNNAKGMDMYSIREPLGVCAGICDFNFPATVILRMFPIAVLCGNTYILKPSEKNPGVAMKVAALAMEASLPDGVLNIVHGGNDIIKYICGEDEIKAISLFGSYTVGMNIFAEAAACGKRILANIGSRNYAVVLPDACMDATLNAVVGAGFGIGGECCCPLSSVIFVGHPTPWEEELVKRAKALKVGGGVDANADVGPVISKEVKDRICRLVQTAVDSGARVLLDGRNIVVQGYERGNFVGPTILSGITTTMQCCEEDVVGPVLLCSKVSSLEEAINVVNQQKFCNGASIFTESGAAARKFQNEVEAKVVGVNVLASSAGDLNFSGQSGIQFYTQVKMVAQKWKYQPTQGIMSTKTLTYFGASSSNLSLGDSSLTEGRSNERMISKD